MKWRGYRNTSRKLYIVGSGGHGLSLASLAVQSGFKEVSFLDMISNQPEVHGLPNLSFIPTLPSLNGCSVAIAIGDNFVRNRVYEDVVQLATEMNITLNFPNLVHPRVSIARNVSMGRGNQFFPQSNIGAGTDLGDFVILNHLSSIDHESRIGSFSSFAPAAITGGKVTIGKRSALLLSSAVSHHVSIGSDTVLAANSFLKEDIGDLCVYGGSPAHFIRNRVAGEAYL